MDRADHPANRLVDELLDTGLAIAGTPAGAPAWREVNPELLRLAVRQAELLRALRALEPPPAG
jgi:hypothetical protein